MVVIQYHLIIIRHTETLHTHSHTVTRRLICFQSKVWLEIQDPLTTAHKQLRHTEYLQSVSCSSPDESLSWPDNTHTHKLPVDYKRLIYSGTFIGDKRKLIRKELPLLDCGHRYSRNNPPLQAVWRNIRDYYPSRQAEGTSLQVRQTKEGTEGHDRISAAIIHSKWLF